MLVETLANHMKILYFKVYKNQYKIYLQSNIKSKHQNIWKKTEKKSLQEFRLRFLGQLTRNTICLEFDNIQTGMKRQAGPKENPGKSQL